MATNAIIYFSSMTWIQATAVIKKTLRWIHQIWSLCGSWPKFKMSILMTMIYSCLLMILILFLLALIPVRLYLEFKFIFVSSKFNQFQLKEQTPNFIPLSQRLTKNLINIHLNPNPVSLTESIFSIPIQNWLEEFPSDSVQYPSELAQVFIKFIKY